MIIEANSFKGWGYPFIAHDYEGEFNVKCPNATLYGIVVESGDKLEEIMHAINWCISEKYPAIMIELAEVENTYLASDVAIFAAADLTAAGYKDLQSYEHRLAFGRPMD
jgi:hypothetical protein